MKPSTELLVAAAVIGAPIWMLPDSKAQLGANAFFALAAISFGLCGAGLWRWYRDGE